MLLSCALAPSLLYLFLSNIEFQIDSISVMLSSTRTTMYAIKIDSEVNNFVLKLFFFLSVCHLMLAYELVV